MLMTASVRQALAALACTVLAACAGSSGEEGDCDSHYEPVGRAATWAGLQDAMLDSTEWGRIASLRTQARGPDVDGSGAQDVVRVMDLLDRRGRRLVQVDVWRTETGGWRSGAWSQCIDGG